VDLVRSGKITWEERGSKLVLTGEMEEFRVVFDVERGELEEYAFRGEDLLLRGPVPNFWRPPTDNDYGNGMPVRQGVWREASRTRVVRGVERWQNSDRDVEVYVTVDLPAVGASHITGYRVYGNGEMVVTSTLTLSGPELPDLPKFGLTLHLSKTLEEVAWFGRGPQESYRDRKWGAPVGLNRSTVADLFHPYIRPQETGNRTDVRWASFEGWGAVGLLVVADPVMEFSALPYEDEDLDEGDTPIYRHVWDLRERDGVILDVDLGQMGVGGDTSWGARPHPQYRLPAQPYRYRVRLIPFQGGEERIRELVGQRW